MYTSLLKALSWFLQLFRRKHDTAAPPEIDSWRWLVLVFVTITPATAVAEPFRYVAPDGSIHFANVPLKDFQPYGVRAPSDAPRAPNDAGAHEPPLSLVEHSPPPSLDADVAGRLPVATASTRVARAWRGSDAPSHERPNPVAGYVPDQPMPPPVASPPPVVTAAAGLPILSAASLSPLDVAVWFWISAGTALLFGIGWFGGRFTRTPPEHVRDVVEERERLAERTKLVKEETALTRAQLELDEARHDLAGVQDERVYRDRIRLTQKKTMLCQEEAAFYKADAARAAAANNEELLKEAQFKVEYTRYQVELRRQLLELERVDETRSELSPSGKRRRLQRENAFLRQRLTTERERLDDELAKQKAEYDARHHTMEQDHALAEKQRDIDALSARIAELEREASLSPGAAHVLKKEKDKHRVVNAVNKFRPVSDHDRDFLNEEVEKHASAEQNNHLYQ